MSRPTTGRELRLAIVGTGGIAKRHAERFQSIPGCRVVAVCDVIEARARDFAESFSIAAVHTDFGNLLEQEAVEAVSNATPDAFHAPLSIQAIQAGKHVLCEKPLALNYQEARSMLLAAEQRGVVGMVQFSCREAPAIEAARQLVATGEIGEVVHVDGCYLQGWLAAADWQESDALLWRLSTQAGSGGALADIGVHLLDFASYPVGEVTAISARLPVHRSIRGKQIRGFVLNANDTASMQIDFACGATGTLHATRWAAGHGNTIQLRIFGTKGSLRIDLARSRDTLEICRGANMRLQQWEELPCPPIPDNFQRFVEAIRNQGSAEPGFACGAKIQALLDAAVLSDQKRRTVTITEISGA